MNMPKLYRVVKSGGFVCMEIICRMNAEARVRDTPRALRGLEKEEKILTKGIRKAFAAKKTLAINLGLVDSFGLVASKVGGRAFTCQEWKGQR